MHDFAKTIMECVKTKVDGIGLDNLDMSNLCELEKWVCIADKIAEYDYYYHITEAMENPEEKYGETYDENGKYYTRMRDSRGRYMRGYNHNNRMYHDDMRGYDPEYYRDMDMDDDRMYYTENRMNIGNSSRYEKARRGYEESKQMNPSKENTSAIETIFDVLEDDMRELKTKMTPTEKEMTKRRITDLMNMM